MATLTGGNAFALFIGATLLLLAVFLLVWGRRRSEGLVLATFLSLVGLNYVFNGVGQATQDIHWQRWAFAALALDPFFLLLFVTQYPYRRRTKVTMVLLLAIGAAGLLCEYLVLFRPAWIVTANYQLNPSAWGHKVIVGQLAVAYAASWIVALQSLVGAPTPLLARRAAWSVVAVGVAVLPRLGVLPADFTVQIAPLLGLPDSGTWPYAVVFYALQAASIAAIAALMFAVPVVVLSRRRQLSEPARVALRLTAAVVAALMIANLLIFEAAVFGLLAGVGVIIFGLRWIVFAATLVSGMLAHEMLDFPRFTANGVTVLGGLTGAVAGAFLTAALVSRAGAAWPLLVGLGVTGGFAAAAPSALMARWAVRSLAHATELPRAERRLELYRAAAESAWARGPPGPDARRRLEGDRRAFGLSVDEARALEHVAASSFRTPAQPLRGGEEALPGIVLERILGEGGQGRVFLARNLASGRRVIVKEFRTDLTNQDARRRLLAEAAALRGLKHPALPVLLQATVSGHRALLVSEYVEGETLAARLARGPLSPPELGHLLEALLRALEFVHARGLLHRDLKPANVILGRDGRPHIVDFGLAIAAEGSDGWRATISGLGALGALAGTLAYMAPEQARGEKATKRTDLYVLGLIAYEALAGRPALDLRGTTALRALERAAEPVIDWEPVPPAWRPWLEKALDPDPLRRFPNARAMRAALPVPEAALTPGTRGGSAPP